MAFNALDDVRKLRQVVFEWAKPDWLKAAESFFAKYTGHPALEQDSIYALPSTLIDPICKYVDLFTPEEEGFERRLSDISGLGYFLKCPVGCSLPFGCESPRVNETWQNIQNRQIKSNKAIIELLTEVMLKQGVSSDEIEAYFKDEREWELKFEDIRMGFSGWLATEPAFRQEVAKLRAKWEDRIRINKRLPMISISINGELGWPVPMTDRDMHADFMVFYWRWGLETLATWDLPVPVLPGLTQPSLYGQIDQDNMGLVSFIPWHFLREKGIDIQQFAKHRGLGSISPRLKNWLNAEPKNWGCGRYGQMLRLFLFFELAIKPRYGDRLRGMTGNFEEAFLFYLNGEMKNVSIDNLCKIRQEMNRRINLCSKPSAVANY
jgi:hypothetical protein